MMLMLRPLLVAGLLCALAVAPLPTLAAATAASAPGAASAPAIAPTASAPARTEPRLATPEAKRDSGTAPGDLRPEARVTPQLNVPLTPSGAGKPAYVRPSQGKATPSGGIDDSAARCQALADAQARKDCLDKLR